jgi:hypothetical protein
MKQDETRQNRAGRRFFLIALRFMGVSGGLLILAVLFSGEVQYSRHAFYVVNGVALGIYCVCAILPWRKIPLVWLRRIVRPSLIAIPPVLVLLLEINLRFPSVPTHPLSVSVGHICNALFTFFWISQIIAMKWFIRNAVPSNGEATQ